MPTIAIYCYQKISYLSEQNNFSPLDFHTVHLIFFILIRRNYRYVFHCSPRPTTMQWMRKRSDVYLRFARGSTECAKK